MNFRVCQIVLGLIVLLFSQVTFGDEEPISVEDLDYLCREIFADADLQIEAFVRYLEAVKIVEAQNADSDQSGVDRLGLNDIEAQERILSYMEQLLAYYRSSPRVRTDSRKAELQNLGRVLDDQRARVLAMRKPEPLHDDTPDERQLKQAQNQILILKDPAVRQEEKLAALQDYWTVLHAHASTEGNDKGRDVTLQWMIGVSKIHLCQEVSLELRENKVPGADQLEANFNEVRKRIEAAFGGLGFSQFEAYYFGYKEVLDEKWERVELNGDTKVATNYKNITQDLERRLETINAAEFARTMIFRKSVVQEPAYPRFLQAVETQIFPEAAQLIAKTRASTEIQVYYSKWLDDYIVLFDAPVGTHNTKVLWIAMQSGQWTFLPQRKATEVQWISND